MIEITRNLLLIILVFACTGTQAQVNRFSGWFMLMNTNKINKRFSTHFDFQLRSDDNWRNMENVLIRPGLNINLDNKMILTAGYAANIVWRHAGDARGPLLEHRIWQQLVIPHDITGKILVNHRFRLEERFIPHAVNVNNKVEKDGYRYVTRFRYFFRSIFPIPYKSTFNNGFFAAVQNEVMFNVTGAKNINNKFFDQNRFYGAVGWRLRKELDLEFGYLNQYIDGRSTGYVDNNILQFAVYLRL